MAQAEAKYAKRWIIGACIFGVLVYQLFFLPYSPHGGVGYPHYWFKDNEFYVKVIGFLSCVAWLGYVARIYLRLKDSDSAKLATIVIFIWFALNCALLAGFNFDLKGLEY